MYHLRSTLFLAIVCCLLTTFGAGRAVAEPSKLSVGTIKAITDPMTRQVVQRRDDNVGNILFVGTYTGNVSGFQASSTLLAGMRGTPVGWTALIDVTIFEGYFIGIFRQPAGGFYNLQIRPVFEGEAGEPVTVSTVGVGEVFITAGQSNSTNWGYPTGFVPSLLVSSFDPGPDMGMDTAFTGASWQYGIDPQPTLDGSNAGSVWPTMANNLSYALGVPIGLYSCGYTGTLIAEWLPGYVLAPATNTTPEIVLFTHLINAIEYLNDRGGVRAILWDQGESDYGFQTNPALYKANLQYLINQSRGVTGVPIKWMVAQAASPLTVSLASRIGIEEAQALVVDNFLTFAGPNTDAIGLAYRYNSSIGPLHFNVAGLELLGGYWGIDVASTPGFLDVGVLPPY
jgi:hypothetical protein